MFPYSAMTNPVSRDDSPAKGEYQDWCRLLLQFGHHDIWWVKAAQLKAGNLTLVLLAAIVGTRKLLWPKETDLVSTDAMILLGIFGGLTFLLGASYSWSLFRTLVDARDRVRQILDFVDDPNGVFDPAKREPWRDVAFPLAITLAEAVAWGVSLHYLGAREGWQFALPVFLWVNLSIMGFEISTLRSNHAQQRTREA